MHPIQQKVQQLLNQSRVKGSSLFFAMVFAIVVLSLAFLLQLSQNGFFYVYSDYAQQRSLMLLVKSAAVVDRTDTLPVQKSFYRKLNVFNDDNDFPVAIARQRWGAFEVQKLYGQTRRYHRKEAYLLGQDFFFQADGEALYLADMDKPLILVGAAMVDGKVTVPNDGIFPGNIDGQYYRFKQLVDGNISANASGLPPIDAGLSSFWQCCFDGSIKNRDSLQVLDASLLLRSSTPFSFFSPTAFFFFQGSASLNNVSIAGNAIVGASDRVVIPSSCKLDNVIVFARKIIVESGFRGRAQLFARDTIAIAAGATLTYPSVAMVMVDSKSNHKGTILLDKGAMLSGALVFSDERKADIFSLSGVEMEEGSTVNGIVYCNGMLSLAGEVNGSVYTRYFFVKRYSGFYVNYLLNGIISFSRLSTRYNSPFVLGKKYKKAVMEELW